LEHPAFPNSQAIIIAWLFGKAGCSSVGGRGEVEGEGSESDCPPPQWTECKWETGSVGVGLSSKKIFEINVCEMKY